MRASAVRRWVQRKDQGPEIQYIADLLSKSLPSGKGICHEDTLVPPRFEVDDIDVDSEIHEIEMAGHIKELVNRAMRTKARKFGSMTFRKRININGIIYATSETHKGNSVIEYFAFRNSRRTIAGVIQHIAVGNEQAFLVVRPFLPLPEGEYDHFSVYQDFQARTCMDYKLAKELEVIDCAWQLKSHVASFQIPDTDKVIIISLSRF